MSQASQLEIWLVTGSISVYGKEALRQIDDHTRDVCAYLDSHPDIVVAVRAKEVVTSPEQIRAVVRDANASGSCIGVVAWMHTFSPARMWAQGLAALRKPLLHLHTQYNSDLPWSEIDMDFMNLNQSAHGDREFAYLETRMRLARKTVVGHWRDPDVARRVGTWARAACGWHELGNLRVARFGDNMRSVAVTEGDKVEAELCLGVSVNGYGLADLVKVVQEISDGEVDALIDEYEDAYEVAPELARGGERHESLRVAARIEGGLRAFLEAGSFRAFTDTFEDLGGLRQLPGISAQRLMAEGYGFGAEGDWKTAVLLRAVKVMTEGLGGGTSFMEDYTYHFGSRPVKVLGAHMLELCPSIAGATPRCEVHPLALGQRDDPVRLVFTAAPGPAVLAAWMDLGTRFRMVANEIDVVPPDEELPRLPVPRAVWEPRPDLATAAQAWMCAGGSHHTVFSSAATTEMLADFATMAGLELVVIDNSTRVREFENELRWNQVYYHLARGL